MKVNQYLKDVILKRGAGYLILIDPDKIKGENLREFVKTCESSGVDGFLVGGSLIIKGELDETIQEIKKVSKLPVIIFPGGVEQISKFADAILFISLISGRNPEHLFGKHVIAAPIIHKLNLETISCGYMILDTGKLTTVEYLSGSLPLPANKPEIAVATALAAQYLGMSFVYLEAGSGAQNSVPEIIVKQVAGNLKIPLIVGGGITTPDQAHKLVSSGAEIIVTGNYFEDANNWNKISLFAKAVHHKEY